MRVGIHLSELALVVLLSLLSASCTEAEPTSGNEKKREPGSKTAMVDDDGARACDEGTCTASRSCCTESGACGFDLSDVAGPFTEDCIEQNQPGAETTDCPAGQPLCEVEIVCPWLPGCRLPSGACGFIVGSFAEQINDTDVLVHELDLGCVAPMVVGR